MVPNQILEYVLMDMNLELFILGLELKLVVYALKVVLKLDMNVVNAQNGINQAEMEVMYVCIEFVKVKTFNL